MWHPWILSVLIILTLLIITLSVPHVTGSPSFNKRHLESGLNRHRHPDSVESVELLTWGRDPILHRGHSRNDLHLSHYPPHHSLVVLIVNDIPWTERGLRNLSGEFAIHAPPGQGIMAVVQVLYLRSAKGQGQGQGRQDHQCIDYIQFYDPITGLGSPKTCGKLRKEDKSFAPGDVLGVRVFSSPASSGIIQVAYSSDKGDPDFPTDKNYDLSFHMVEIVFTAVKDCSSLQNQDISRMSPCGSGCISRDLFCDQRINCGNEMDFALDELNCSGDEFGIYSSHNHTQFSRLFLISLYLGAGLFLLILASMTLYHQHTAYRRITNIPHK